MNIRSRFLLVLSMFLLCTSLKADNSNNGSGLLLTTKQSDVIIVAKIIRIVRSPLPKTDVSKSVYIKLGRGLPSVQVSVTDQADNPAGVYDVFVIGAVKGRCPGRLNIKLPELSDTDYNFAQPRFKANDEVLLFLQRKSNNFIPVGNGVPIIPISHYHSSPNGETFAGDPAYQHVLDVMLASLRASDHREVITYLLSNIVDAKLETALKPYEDDPNLSVEGNVLYCLAENGQVEVIPKIAALQNRLSLAGEGSLSVGALSDFNTSDAVPYLNPLVCNANEFTRLNAMESLLNLADRTSIPYLLLALHDPDRQQVIRYQAYDTVCRLTKTHNRADVEDFDKHQQHYVKPLLAWWADELTGKHNADTVGGTASENEQPPLRPIRQDVKYMLFDPSVIVRRAAISKLEQVPSRDSIPYLMIALQDPDKQVSYEAYTLLHKLIKILGPPKAMDLFDADPQASVLPLYTWWTEELSEKHVNA